MEYGIWTRNCMALRIAHIYLPKESGGFLGHEKGDESGYHYRIVGKSEKTLV